MGGYRMTEFYEAQEEIIEKIEAICAAAKIGCYDGALPSGEQLRSTNGRYWPYVIYALGGKSPLANRQKGIGSSADDAKWTALSFFCVADTPRTVRRVKEVLRDEFEGYVHGLGWGQMEEVLSGDFGISKPDPDLQPLRHGEPLIFKVVTDV